MSQYKINADSLIINSESVSELDIKMYFDQQNKDIDNIKTIIINKSVKVINTTFNNFTNLEKFDVDTDNNHYCSIRKILYNKIKKTIQDETDTLVRCPLKISGTVKIPQYIKIIDKNAFYNCNNVELISFTGVGVLTEIKEYAFYNCKLLQIIKNIPSTLEKIGNYCFENCVNLISIDLSNIIDIGINSLRNCKNLEDIIISDKNKNIKNTDGILIKNKKEIIYCKPDINTKDIIIDNDVIKIREFSFYNCDNIENITLHDNITYIGKNCFENCKKLETIQLSNKLDIINDYMFFNCRKLENIVIPDNIKTYGKFCFSKCVSLRDITISHNVVLIDKSAFEDCVNLKNIIFKKFKNIETIHPTAFNNIGVRINIDTGCFNDDKLDECGVCGGKGIPEGHCNCYIPIPKDHCDCEGNKIPEGDCDCRGNKLDDCGICGGNNRMCFNGRIQVEESFMSKYGIFILLGLLCILSILAVIVFLPSSKDKKQNKK